MSQLVIQDLDDRILTRLKQLASQHGRTMSDEILHILRSAVSLEEAHESSLGTKIADRFKGQGLDRPIAELRGSTPKSPDFEA